MMWAQLATMIKIKTLVRTGVFEQKQLKTPVASCILGFYNNANELLRIPT